MAIARVKTWANAEILFAADLNAEYDNIINNALSLVSPLTGDLAFGGFRGTGFALGTAGSPTVQITGDTNTGAFSPLADAMSFAGGGFEVLRAAGPAATAATTVFAEDARTATVDVPLIVQSTTTGVPAANIGTGIQFNAESGDENPSVFGRLDFAASDITAASEDTYMDILLRVAGAAEETKYRFASTAAAGFQGTFTHAATADRTWTLPDSSVTLGAGDVTLTGTETLTNKTLTTPVIGGAAPATPVANTLYTDSVIKGWVETSGAGAWTIDDDLNVTSITDNGVGDFTINWATAFANANYVVAAMAITSDTIQAFRSVIGGKLTGSTQLQLLDTNAVALGDPVTGVMVLAIGDV